MPTNIASPWYKRAFVQTQTVFEAVNNTGGTWNPTGAQYIRIGMNGFQMTPNMPKNIPRWFTGTRSTQPGILGRKSANERGDIDLIPSGAAGTVPDMDQILAAAFGQPATVVASTSVTYNLTDAIPSALTLFLFQHGFSTLTQQLMWGSAVTEVEFILNQNFLTMNVSIEGAYLLDSDNFASEPTVAKAGLTVYPAEPGGTPASAGVSIPGFGPDAATATFDSLDLAAYLTSARITYRTGYRVPNDVVKSAYGAQIIAGLRQVSAILEFRDSDDASMVHLKQKAKSNAVIPVVITIGQVAGSIVAFHLNDFQPVPQTFRDEEDWVAAAFPESMAHATAIGNTDEMSLVLT